MPGDVLDSSGVAGLLGLSPTAFEEDSVFFNQQEKCFYIEKPGVSEKPGL